MSDPVNLDAVRAVAKCQPVSTALPGYALAMADEIERLGNVAVGRLRWISMMLAGGEHHDLVAHQAREWADEMDPNLQNEER